MFLQLASQSEMMCRAFAQQQLILANMLENELKTGEAINAKEHSH